MYIIFKKYFSAKYTKIFFFGKVFVVAKKNTRKNIRDFEHLYTHNLNIQIRHDKKNRLYS